MTGIIPKGNSVSGRLPEIRWVSLRDQKSRLYTFHLLCTTIRRLERNDLVTVVVTARSRGVETVEDEVEREGEWSSFSGGVWPQSHGHGSFIGKKIMGWKLISIWLTSSDSGWDFLEIGMWEMKERLKLLEKWWCMVYRPFCKRNSHWRLDRGWWI